MNSLRPLPTAHAIASRLSYNAVTGQFAWLPCPARSKQWNCRFAGKPTGSVDSDTGYVRIRLDGTLYYAHRLAWLLATGVWPQEQVDHRNGDRADNRLVNLREASRGENCQNAALRSDNASGATGAWLDRRSGKWVAEIASNRRRFRLGTFETREAAAAAYLEAKRGLHSFQPVPRWVGGVA